MSDFWNDEMRVEFLALQVAARKMMVHQHGDTTTPKAHAKELGHHDDAGA